MRLWHLVFGIFVVAIVLGLCREPVGRVAVIVFVTGLGEFAFGTAALMALFQTLGALGEAKTFVTHIEAVASTAFVLALATAIMTGWLFLGAALVIASVR
jgi:hypothetical protein